MKKTNTTVKKEISRFPNTFALRGFYGDLFRIGRRSYVAGGGVQLVVEVRRKEGWSEFWSAEPAELRKEIALF